MKKITCLLLCLGFLAMASAAQAFEAFSGSTELLYHDETKAQNGVNMFSAGLKKGKGQNWILDNNGQKGQSDLFPGPRQLYADDPGRLSAAQRYQH